MNDFDYEVLQRKRIATGARHKRNGSKSRKCSLPSDHLTRKEWKHMNGEVNTYNLRSPMDWMQFKDMPEDLKKEYITWLVNEFSVTQGRLAEAFSISRITLIRELDELECNNLFPKGNRMSAEEKLAFYDFWWPARKGVRGIGGTDPLNEDEIVCAPVQIEPREEDIHEEPETAAPMVTKCGTLNFRFDGVPDLAPIEALLRQVFGDTKRVTVSIQATLLEGDEEEA